MADPRFRALAGTADDATPVAELLGSPIRIRLEADASWARQVCAIALADLLGRTFPRIDLAVDPAIAASPTLPPGPGTVLERMQQAREHALIDPEAAADHPAVTIVVGDGGAGDIFIDGDGWLSYLGETPGGLAGADGTNPIGALCAACRGASQVIQRVLGSRLPETTQVAESYWSALTLGQAGGPGAPNPRLANPVIAALLMGGGSIGGATGYALARVPGLDGELVVVDFDRLEDRNSLKALLARRDGINAGALKIDVLVDELAHLPLDVMPFHGTFASWVASRPADEPLPLCVSAVDSIPSRRELADHMPLQALNAACDDSHIVLSGHRTDDGPCVYCLYIRDVLDESATRAKMIHRETGLAPGFIDQYRIKRLGLNSHTLTAIARYRGMDDDALHHREGMTLDDLFAEEFLYGEVRLAIDRGEQAGSTLQLTSVPALAGILLAGEMLKCSDERLREHRLGPDGILGTEYAEGLLQPPVGMISTLPRWSTSECLCRSVRRLKLMRARHGLDQASGPASRS